MARAHSAHRGSHQRTASDQHLTRSCVHAAAAKVDGAHVKFALATIILASTSCIAAQARDMLSHQALRAGSSPNFAQLTVCVTGSFTSAHPQPGARLSAVTLLPCPQFLATTAVERPRTRLRT